MKHAPIAPLVIVEVHRVTSPADDGKHVNLAEQGSIDVSGIEELTVSV